MNQAPTHEFDPYSDESLKIVETVEALPFNQAFEHMLYSNRIDRVVQFEYAHPEDQEYDPTPLVIDSDIMTTRFPDSLRGIFPEDEYAIEELKIEQRESGSDETAGIYPTTNLLMSFKTHTAEHFISIKDGLATYETQNASDEDVIYTFEPEAIIGLIAAFVYAKQYDPAFPTNAIELAESSLAAARDPRVDFVEQLIITLGNFTGHSTLETRALFENPNGAPIIATLREQEFPDKSFVSNKLILSELTDMNDIPTSTETSLIQKVANIDEKAGLILKGRHDNQYAEQRSTILSSLGVTTSEYIDPKANYSRWVSTCASFLRAIKQPMQAHEDFIDPIL